MNQDTTYQNALHAAKLSNTIARREVFTILASQASPVTMKQLVNLAAQKVDRASVYRTVSAFVEAGIIRKIYTGWKYQLELSDLFNQHHHHFYCLKCHKIISITEPRSLHAALKDISTHYNITISQHDFEMRGLCVDCRA